MPALKDKVVIVTGGGRGIGRGIAWGAALEGAKVLIADNGGNLLGGSPDADVAASAATEIVQAGGEAIGVAESVASLQGARTIVAGALERWGRVDGLVCCAGTVRHRPFLQLTEDDFDSVIATHLRGHFAMFHATMTAMVERRIGGSLIGIGSAYVLGDPSRAPYRTAKAGVIGLTKSVSLAGIEHGIRANVISPIANTRMTKASALTFDSDPDDIAPMAVYLLSDKARKITGKVFSVAGRSISTWHDPEPKRSVQHHGRWDQGAIEAAMQWLEIGATDVTQTPVVPESFMEEAEG